MLDKVISKCNCHIFTICSDCIKGTKNIIYRVLVLYYHISLCKLNPATNLGFMSWFQLPKITGSSDLEDTDIHKVCKRVSMQHGEIWRKFTCLYQPSFIVLCIMQAQLISLCSAPLSRLLSDKINSVPMEVATYKPRYIPDIWKTGFSSRAKTQ